MQVRKKNETHNVKKKPQFKGVAWANPLVDEAVGASASTAVQGEHEKIKLQEDPPLDDAPADVPADGAPLMPLLMKLLLKLSVPLLMLADAPADASR